MPNRIVLFVPGFTERNGGLARHSRLLAEGFAEAGWEVRVISRAGSLRRPALVRQPRLVAIELPGWDRPRLGAVAYLAIAVPLGLWWARSSRGYMAVHLGSTTVAAGVGASVWGRPYTALSTTSGSWSEVAEALRCRHWGLRRRILRRATWLVAQSEATAPELRMLTEPDRVAVVPNPVRLPVPPPPLDGRPRVLVVGRLAAEKGSLTIVQAWRSVLTSVPDAALTFVGIGGSWRSIEEEVRGVVASDDQLAGSISFDGWCDDVPSVLAEHDVFLLASSTEGMSNSLLEACAHGRVIVASDIPQNRAVLGEEYPLLFPVDDAVALEARLVEALKGQSRDKARSRGLEAAQRSEVSVVVAAHARLLEMAGSA